MTARGTLTVVVPGGVDDPLQPSGGNTYDRRLCGALRDAGWSVQVRAAPGAWPHAATDAHRALNATLEHLPGGSLVLVDGLVASNAADVLVPAGQRLRLVVLVHLPIGCGDGGGGPVASEGAVLSASAAVVTTSCWSRRWVLSAYGLDAGRVHVARPGVDPAEPAPGTRHGGRLLCVGAVTRAKGYDVLLAALSMVADRAWHCAWVGPSTRDPALVARLRSDLCALGLEDRVLVAGPRTGSALDRSYAAADLLVVPSRFETYGMVVTEALARGLPVVATDVGGIREALGATGSGGLPGLLVPGGDPTALADALGRWLDDAVLRGRLRDAAARRRAALTGWPDTAGRVAAVLSGVSEVAA